MKHKLIIVLVVLFFVVTYTVCGEVVAFRIFPTDYSLFLDGEDIEPERRENEFRYYDLPEGENEISISAEGFISETDTITVPGTEYYENKLEREDSLLVELEYLPTGVSPKCVQFTPDGAYMLSALLRDDGVDVYETESREYWGRIEFPQEYADEDGFVEIAFAEQRGEIWVSQMTTNSVHIIDLESFEYQATIPTGGGGPKIICIDHNEEFAYVSNWWTEDIGVINMETRQLVDMIPTNGIPRGLALTEDGQYMYACLFSNGNIDKISVPDRTVVSTLQLGPGAMRHTAVDYSQNRLYASDMAWGDVFVIDMETDELLHRVHVGRKVNTIDLTSDGQYLFVSNRGRNNPETYIQEGPEFGWISVLDTETMEIIDWAYGMDQPTGLDVSPDDRYLAFTDFLDDQIELYSIDDFMQWEE
ncbi:MAG: YncE family protein [Spirochaetia bacterium]